jgi:acyl transferase domain-containing protein
MSLAAKSEDSIAIVGLAGRFPDCKDVNSFWQHLIEGRSGVTSVEPRVGSAVPHQPNYVAKTACIKNADYFDAQFFGIYPKQAMDMDPQHRLFLETCWHAMEDAGYIPNEPPCSVGLFAGCHMNTYIFTRLAADEKFRAELADAFPGGSLTAEISNDKDYIATRVAFQLDLRGPSVNVQTACSTSLVAIAQACESLIAKSCDMAIAGGVTATFPQQQGYLHTEDSILSPDGSCRTFDANACGTIFGDGAGAVVLKRLKDAIADRDDIYAVISGWGVNNDGGDKLGYTAPSVSGQSGAIRMAHQRAGISADSIGYVEAHGTGTLVGDPIEIQALTEAFRDTTDKKQFCRIGSLKTNFGHLDVAAGVTGVIKTSLTLKHAKIPAMINFRSPNPKIEFENSPFVINDQLTDWKTEGGPRRAGISSFGVGGTNAHLVMEQAPDRAVTSSTRAFHLLPLSAKTPEALEQMTEDLADHLESNSDEQLADVAYTLQAGRQSFLYKRFVVASDAMDGATKLRARSKKDGEQAAHRGNKRPVVFLLPGQGSQHHNMARELYASEPLFAQHLDACFDALKPHVGDIKALAFPANNSEPSPRLHQTEIAQPTLFAFSYALAKLWQSYGIQPMTMIGHSVGEFAAAAIAGIMTMEEAARLVAIRGKLMQELPTGSMMAIQMPAAQVERILPPTLDLAAINGPSFCVVSGPDEEIRKFETEFASGKHGEDIACRALHTSHAFHSRMMDAAVAPFLAEVKKANLQPPSCSIASSVTAQEMDAATATDANYWARQIREPVRFSDAMRKILEQYPSAILLEVGPNQALSTLTRQHKIDPKQQFIIPSLPHAKQNESDARFFTMTLGKLWQAAASIDWNLVADAPSRNRLHLPLYRFQRKRFSFETELQNRDASPNLAKELNCSTQLPSDENRSPAIPAENIPESHPLQINRSESESSGASRPIAQSVTQEVIARQLEMMNRQMQLLRMTRDSNSDPHR